ncbi:MAG: hypothetical protein KAJ07_04535 [Planctomycetes bacterium]|nr:hypothetical protein [Planctomycetota bacterium]
MNKINCPHCQTTAIENADELAAGDHKFICKNCQHRFDFSVLVGVTETISWRLLAVSYRALSMIVAEMGRILEEEKS